MGLDITPFPHYRVYACLSLLPVMAELETLGKVYPFSIPPFFALILRAFSVIEGIALTVDPDYSIVQVGFSVCIWCDWLLLR